MVELDALQRRTLIWAGLAVVLTAFDGSVLVLALPAIAGDFHARVPALSNLGSVLALGSIGALPLATLADRFGRRRLIAVGVAGFSVANFASAFAPSLEALALLRLVAVCFEVLVGGVATALLAVLLEPAGLLFTLFASQVLHLSPAAISELIIASGVAGAASYVAGGLLSDRFGRRVPGTALTGATAVAASLSFEIGRA